MDEENFYEELTVEQKENFDFIVSRIEERSNGQVYIREISSNPDIIVCKTPDKYLEEICKLCDEDPVKCGYKENGEITKKGYQRMIDFNIGYIYQSTLFGNEIIFEDPEKKYLEDFYKSGEDKEGINNIYDRFTTINCFNTVKEFSEAITSDDPKYSNTRNWFLHCITVSELRDAINCLKGLGLVLNAYQLVELLGGAAAGMSVMEAITVNGLVSQESKITFKILQIIYKINKYAPDQASEIFGDDVKEAVLNAA